MTNNPQPPPATSCGQPTIPNDTISTSQSSGSGYRPAFEMSEVSAWSDHNGPGFSSLATHPDGVVPCNNMHAMWRWWSYLGSTLTGWTLNAINSCFCDKCKCHFSSSLSTLQHLRDSRAHLATCEALEAKGALYAYDCALMVEPSYESECYSLNAYGHYDLPLAPSFQPAAILVEDGEQLASSNRSTSPTQGVEPPSSDIFTASSEVSEELCQPQQDNFKQHDQRQWRQRNKPKPQQGWGGEAARDQKSQRSAPSAPPSTEKYEAAFPSLGGGMPALPVRRWTPAAATRRLRVDAPEWAPGCPVTSFASLGVKATQEKLAAATMEKVQAENNGKIAEDPTIPSSTASGGATDLGQSQAGGHHPKREHKLGQRQELKQKKQEQRQNQKVKAKDTEGTKVQKQDSTVVAEGNHQECKAAVVSWRNIVARSTPTVSPAANP